MTLTWLCEITGGVSGSPSQETLRASSIGYNHPTAPDYYPPRIVDAANIKRTLVGSRRTFGASDISGGEVVLSNIDGHYDEWFDKGYGFTSRLLIVDSESPYGYATVVMTGKVEQPSGDRDTVSFRFRSRQVELERLISPETYAGTNSGLVGTEGTADDIKGESKIRVFGAPRNVSPDPVNVNDRLYAVNHDKAGVLDGVYSIAMRLNGSAWTYAGDDADLVTLQAASITQGNYRTCLAEGLLRLGGSAPDETGGVTVDVVESVTTATNQAASVIERLLLDAGIDSGDIDMGTLAIDAPYRVGVVVKGESYKEIIDKLCASIGGWYAEDALGVYKIRRLISPNSGSPLPTSVATFKRFDYPNVAASDEFEIREIERIVSNDEGRGVPAWRITVLYDQLWTVQDKNALATGLSDSTREYYGREYRSVTVENTSIRAQYPEAVELEFETYLTEESDALDLANHFVELYGVQRSIYRVKSNVVDFYSVADLGDVVTLVHPRYGLQNGKQFVIIGLQYNARTFEVEMELWG